MTTIMIVDDNRELRELVARDVRNQRCDVLVADCYARAVELLHEGNSVDVLVADLRMPDRDGLELIKTVRELSPGTRSILISAFASARDYETALELGAIAVLCKPFSRAQLRAAIDLAVECRTGFHGSIHGIALTDVLQMMHLGRRSASILVGSEISGRIYMRDGEIVHATSGGLVGEMAVARLLLCDTGSIQTGSLPREVPQTVERRFDELLIDLFRMNDEAANGIGAAERSAPASAALVDEEQLPAPLVAVLACYRREEAVFAEAPSLIFVVSLTLGKSWIVRGPAEATAVSAAVIALCRLARTISGGARQGTMELATGGIGIGLAWSDDRDALMALVEPYSGGAGAAWFRARSAAVARCVMNPDAGR